VPGYEWNPARLVVEARGQTITDVIRQTIREIAAAHTFNAFANREDGWWMIRIPMLDNAFTQALTIKEIVPMAKELVAVMLDIPTETARVKILWGVPE
jgi:predicted RNase H-like HicB family nuclease